MAEIIQFRRDDASEWAKWNPILADGEPGRERDTKRSKTGDGTTHWNDLPYDNPGPDGPKGDKGDFSYASELVGSSFTPLKIKSDVHLIAVTDESTQEGIVRKAWVTGMFILVAYTEDPSKYMVGQCVTYDDTTHQLTLNVIDEVYGDEGLIDYSPWNISYTAGTSVAHKSKHLPGGSDEIGLASDTSAGLMSLNDYTKLFNIQVTGVFIGSSEPKDDFGNSLIPTGGLFFCTTDIIYNPPSFAAINPIYHVYGESFSFPVNLTSDWDINSVENPVRLYAVSTTNSVTIPIPSLVITGSGGNWMVTVPAVDLLNVGFAIIRLEASVDNFGVKSNASVRIEIASTVHTVTIVSASNGHLNYSPGITYVAQGSTMTIDPIGDNSVNGIYAISSYNDHYNGTDHTVVPTSGSLVFVVNEDHVITPTFLPGFIVTAGAGINGRIAPSGQILVADSASKLFSFDADLHYEPYQMSINGGNYVPVELDGNGDIIGSHTLGPITSANQSIFVIFRAETLSVKWGTSTGGSALVNGTIAGTASGSAPVTYPLGYQVVIAPATDYETYYLIVDGVDVSPTTPWIVSYTYQILQVLNDINISAGFRIRVPGAVSAQSAVNTSTTNITLTWLAASRATGGYTVYYSTNASLTAQQIKDQGTALANTASLTTIHTVINSSVKYYYAVVALNSTGYSISNTINNAVPVSNVTIASLDIASTQLTATWGVATGAAAYDIYYLANNTSPATIKSTGAKLTGVTSPCAITGLTDYTSYGVIVIARNAFNESTGVTRTAIPEPTISLKLTTPDAYPAVTKQNVNVGSTINEVSLYFYDDMVSKYCYARFTDDLSKNMWVGAQSVAEGVYSYKLAVDIDPVSMGVNRSLGWHKINVKMDGTSLGTIKFDGVLKYTGNVINLVKTITLFVFNIEVPVATAIMYIDKLTVSGSLLSGQDVLSIDATPYWGSSPSTNGTITMDTTFYCPLPF